MKKIIVNERVLKGLVMEALKSSVNEAISTAHAYAKFYADKIPHEIYLQAMKGTENMTPFHKVALDVIGAACKDENFDAASGLAYSCSAFWERADANVRQLLLKVAKAKQFDTSSPESFISSIKTVAETNVMTKNQMSQDGLKVLYEDEYLTVTCTLSYAASTKAYGDTHWCTASDVGGQYNGFFMFKEYVFGYWTSKKAEGLLIQFIPKDKNALRIQALIDCDGFIDEENIMDENDNEIGGEWRLKNMLWDLGSPFNLDEFMESLNTQELRNETTAAVNAETEYWIGKTTAIANKLNSEVEKLIKDNLDSSYPLLLKYWSKTMPDSNDYTGQELYITTNTYIRGSAWHGFGDYFLLMLQPSYSCEDKFKWFDGVPDSVLGDTGQKRCFIMKKNGNTFTPIKEYSPRYTDIFSWGNVGEINQYLENGGISSLIVSFLDGQELPYKGRRYWPVEKYGFYTRKDNDKIVDVVDIINVKKVCEIANIDENFVDSLDGVVTLPNGKRTSLRQAIKNGQ